MKLLKTIERLIQEAEEQYNLACDSCTTVEELDRLENRYKDSLRLMKLYKSKEDKKDTEN
jgi:DNA invertase Pin-like site-specific DNA recombinase